MPIIANTTSSNTFNAVRAQLNSVTKRMNQFSINESAFYANTVTANVSLRISGTLVANSVAGTSGYYLRTSGTGVYWSPVAAGVTSIVAGTGIAISGATGAVTVSQDIYTGSTAKNTNYPVGTTIVGIYATSYSNPPINTSVSVWVNAGGNGFYTYDPGGTSAALSGTWRTKGLIIAQDSCSGAGKQLIQRVS